MPRDSNGGTSGLIGTVIALLATGGGIVALLNYIHPPVPVGSGPTATVTPTPRDCKIEGAVYNDDTDPKQPIPNVRVNYIPNQQNGRVYLTMTGPSGQFRGDCAHISSKDFPLTLELSSPHWQGITSKTGESVPETGNPNITIYVSLKDINNGIIRSRIAGTSLR